jgi:transcriptional regulator with XRE-family HTH domain
MKIVSRLKEIRESKEISISQVHRDTGIPRSSLQDYEMSRGNASIGNAYKLAHYLNVRVDELFVPQHSAGR